jgi:hypothetical protein
MNFLLNDNESKKEQDVLISELDLETDTNFNRMDSNLSEWVNKMTLDVKYNNSDNLAFYKY